MKAKGILKAQNSQDVHPKYEFQTATATYVNVVKVNFYIACNLITGTQIEKFNDEKLIQNLRLNSIKID